MKPSRKCACPWSRAGPGVDDLLFDAGYRFSDYSSGVSANTYKFEVQYAPIADYPVPRVV